MQYISALIIEGQIISETSSNEYKDALEKSELIVKSIRPFITQDHWTCEGFRDKNNITFIGGHWIYDRGCVVCMSIEHYRKLF